MFSVTAVTIKEGLTASVSVVFILVFNNLIGAKVKYNHLKFPRWSLPFLLITVQFLLPPSPLELELIGVNVAFC